MFSFTYSSNFDQMKKTLLILSALCIYAGTSYSQSVYKNGYLSTGNVTKDGTTAPAGYTWSEVQNNAGNTTESNTVSGFSSGYGSGFNFSVADNFVVPAGQQWSVTGFNFYAYQTLYSGSTSPFDIMRFQVWDGPPDIPGSNIIYGDLTTNRLTSSYDSLMYRVFNTKYPSPGSPPGTTRIIWKLEGSVSGLVLNPGNYWVEFQTHAKDNGSHFAPPATIVDSRGSEDWNGKQHNIGTNTWADLVDAGNPPSAPDYIQDLPFEVVYTNLLPVKFKSFDGVMQNGQSLLKWTTTNEVNNKGFDVERSADGQVFSPIGFVAGQNQAGDNDYTFTDVKPLTGVNYYRLKQIDNDGKFSYSSIIQLKNDISEFVWNVYPNPIVNEGWMQIQLPKAARVAVQVVSSNGSLISQIDKGTLQTGSYSIPLNLDKAAKGTYIIKLMVDTKTYNKTVVK